MTLPLIVLMFLVKIKFNVFLMEQCVESFFLLFRQHGRWRRRWCGQRISSLPAGMHSGLVWPIKSNKSLRLSISSAVSSQLGMELGGRWRTESRGGDGWITAPSPPMNEDVINSSRWNARVLINGGGGFACRVSVESFLREYNIDESQQNLPPRFLKMIRTCIQSTD